MAYGDKKLDFVRPFEQFIVCDDTHHLPTKSNEISFAQILQNMGFHIDTIPIREL